MGLPKKMSSDQDRFLPDQKDLQQSLPECEVDHDKELEEPVSASSVPVLKIKLPIGGGDYDGTADGGCSTPKAVDHENIPLICPPTPRKPKSLPSKKRKLGDSIVLLDLSNEIVPLFPPSILRDFVCGKIKKVRTDNMRSLG